MPLQCFLLQVSFVVFLLVLICHVLKQKLEVLMTLPT